MVTNYLINKKSSYNFVIGFFYLKNNRFYGKKEKFN